MSRGFYSPGVYILVGAAFSQIMYGLMSDYSHGFATAAITAALALGACVYELLDEYKKLNDARIS